MTLKHLYIVAISAHHFYYNLHATKLQARNLWKRFSRCATLLLLHWYLCRQPLLSESIRLFQKNQNDHNAKQVWISAAESGPDLCHCSHPVGSLSFLVDTTQQLLKTNQLQAKKAQLVDSCLSEDFVQTQSEYTGTRTSLSAFRRPRIVSSTVLSTFAA